MTIPIPAAAIAANVTTRTIRRWIAAGLPTTRANGQHLIDLADLDDWLRSRRKCPTVRDRWAVPAQVGPAKTRGFAIGASMSEAITRILADHGIDEDEQDQITQRILSALQSKPAREIRIIHPAETR